MVAISSIGERVEHVVQLGFLATNNVTKYEALLVRAWVSHTLSTTSVTIHTDSQLVACQLSGEFMHKEDNMALYIQVACNALEKFPLSEIVQVNRYDNAKADALA